MVAELLKDIERGDIEAGDLVMKIEDGQLKRYIDIGLVKKMEGGTAYITDVCDNFDTDRYDSDSLIKLGNLDISKMHKIQRRLRNADKVANGDAKTLGGY